MAQSPSHRPNRHPGLDTVVSIQTDSPIAPSVAVSPDSSAGGVTAGPSTPSTPQIIIRPDFGTEDSCDGGDQDAADQQSPSLQGHHHHHHHHHLPHPGAGGSITILTPPAPASASSAVSRINICINNHYTPKPAPKPRRLHEQYGLSDDVLVRKEHDDRYYLGTIVAIGARKCLVRFDDGNKCWSFFEDMKKMEVSGSDGAANELVDHIARMPKAICIVCKEDKPQQVVEVCEQCRRCYHPRCQTEQQPDQPFDEESESPEAGPWLCRRCTTPSCTPPPGCSGMANRFVGTGLSQELDPLTDKDQLPYDLDALVWDAPHQVNQTGQYCYCGEDGDWAKEMIQCCWCLQWFHGRCIRSLQFPIFLGDRFYVLLCSICNGGHEFVRRLETSYKDLLQLVLYNLMMRNGQRLFNLSRAILPYLEDNLRTLQAPDHISHTSPTARAEAVEQTLKKERSVFVNGKELNKSPNLWTLRVCQAPEKIAINIPRGETVTENLLQQPTIHLRILPRAYLEKSLVTDAATRERMTCIKYNVSPFSEVDPRQTTASAAVEVDGSSGQQSGAALPKRRGRPPRAACKVATGDAEAGPFVRRTSNRRKQTGSSGEAWKRLVEEAKGTPQLDAPCPIDAILPPPPDLLGENNPFRREEVAVPPRLRQGRIVKRRLSTIDDLYAGRNKKRKLSIGGGTAVRITPPVPERRARRQSTGAMESSTGSAATTVGQFISRRLRPRIVANYSDSRRYRRRGEAANEENNAEYSDDDATAPSRPLSPVPSIPEVSSFSEDERVGFEALPEVVVKQERISEVPDEQEVLQCMQIEKEEEQIQERYENAAPLPLPSPFRNNIKCVRTLPDGRREYLWE
uniref:Uncharacterized protein n=1 Tax=Anopheles atroparvus TaxID=41427 RepID=A0A182IL06_ANOAO